MIPDTPDKLLAKIEYERARLGKKFTEEIRWKQLWIVHRMAWDKNVNGYRKRCWVFAGRIFLIVWMAISVTFNTVEISKTHFTDLLAVVIGILIARKTWLKLLSGK